MKKPTLVLLALSALPTLAHAHPGTGVSGLAHGFQHPLFGLDHLLAMLAIGLWAAQIGGRAIWAIPAAFVGTMAVGGALGMTGLSLPMMEPGVAASVLILGLLITFAVRMPLAAALPLVALFALFHGHAHGAEMPANTSGVTYALGFVAATALLHATGIALGVGIQRLSTAPMVRLAGAAIAMMGVAIFLG